MAALEVLQKQRLEQVVLIQFLAQSHLLAVVLVEARRLVVALLADQAAVKKVALQPVVLRVIHHLPLHRKVARAGAVIVLVLAVVVVVQVLLVEMPQCLY